MLSINPARVLHLRNIAKPFAYLRKNGFNHHTTYLLLKGSLSSVKLEHIQQLCHLLNCSPQDLLAYTPDADAPDAAKDTLAPLIRQNTPLADLNTFFQEMPLDRIETFTKEITDRLGSQPNQEPTAS